MAQSRIEKEQTRLMVLKAAHMMYLYGNKVSYRCRLPSMSAVYILTIQADVGQSRIEIEQLRLMVLKAAHMMDLYGNKVGYRCCLPSTSAVYI